jgi:hypothetical protein
LSCRGKRYALATAIAAMKAASQKAHSNQDAIADGGVYSVVCAKIEIKRVLQ